MTIFELMTQLSAFDGDSIDMAAKATVQAGITGAKDIYMAWGKEKGIAAKTLETEWKGLGQRAITTSPCAFTAILWIPPFHLFTF